MTNEKLCPSCKKNVLHPIDARNALSRRDNKTYICEACGTAEAIEDMNTNYTKGKK